MGEVGEARRRFDGSLDTDYYRAVARRLRSAATRRWLQTLVAGLRRRRAGALPRPAHGGK